MYTLIDLKNESQAEYLNSALRRHGLNSFVLNTGIAPDGVKMFSITCHNASDLKKARQWKVKPPRLLGPNLPF